MEIKISPLNFKYPALPFVIMFFVGIPVAMFFRLQIIQQTTNVGLGNVTFVTFFMIWNFLYFAVVDSTYHLQDSFKKKMQFLKQDKSMDKIKNTLREDFQETSMENNVSEDKLPISNYVENDISEIKISEKAVNDIIKKNNLSRLQSEKIKLEDFLLYTKITMTPYVTSDDFKKLEAYVRKYSHDKEITSFDFLIHTQELSTDDLINFGYNMVNHFNFTILETFGPVLMNMFKMLNGLTLNTITRKLHFRSHQKKLKINCIRNITKYLEDLNKDS